MARKRKGKGNGKGNGMMLLGMLAGAAVGAAVGLVFSPSDGERNRQHLSEWAAGRAQELQEKAQSTIKGE